MPTTTYLATCSSSRSAHKAACCGGRPVFGSFHAVVIAAVVHGASLTIMFASCNVSRAVLGDVDWTLFMLSCNGSVGSEASPTPRRRPDNYSSHPIRAAQFAIYAFDSLLPLLIMLSRR